MVYAGHSFIICLKNLHVHAKNKSNFFNNQYIKCSKSPYENKSINKVQPTSICGLWHFTYVQGDKIFALVSKELLSNSRFVC